MQAVILAGGKGTRMKEVSSDVPKPMLLVNGKNLLQHKIDRLPEDVDEIILIVHHKKEVIMDFFGSSYNGRKIIYVDPQAPKGTAHALFAAEPFLRDEFLSIMGDDIYSENALQEIIKYPWAMTVYPAKSFPTAADIVVDEKEYFKSAMLDDLGVKGDILVDVGLYKLNREIFSSPLVAVSTSKEWGLPHTIFQFLKNTKTDMKVVRADWWMKINSPEDLKQAEIKLQKIDNE